MDSITVTDLVKHYGEHIAVNRITFAVPKGEIFGFLGPNGAGKTTTINVLCTLVKPTAGTATVNGYDVHTQCSEVRRSIGLVFQEPTLDDYLTAEQNLLFHAYAYGVPRAVREERMRELLTLVENIRGAVQIGDIRLLEGLTWNAAFLLESLVVEDDEARGSTSDRLRRCVRNALANGSSVVVAADSPVGSTPQRSSFRLEPIEAAMDTGCPLIPVYADGGNGSAIDGISTASAFLRIGDPLPLDGVSCTEIRQALRNAIERLMNDDRPAPTPD